MSDLIAINAGAFNLVIQALKRAGKDEIAEQLESDCECVPDLIEQLQQRNDELAATVDDYRNRYERKDLVWFERCEVGGLDPEQVGFIDLNAVKREAIIELSKEAESAFSMPVALGFEEIQQYANTKYPSGKDGE